MKVYVVFKDCYPEWIFGVNLIRLRGTETYMSAVFDNEKDAENFVAEHGGWIAETELNTICNMLVAICVE